MVQMHSNNREEIKGKGWRYCCCIGLKDITTGDTLSDANKPIILEKMDFPEPVISVAVEPSQSKIKKKCPWLWVSLHKRILHSVLQVMKNLGKQ